MLQDHIEVTYKKLKKGQKIAGVRMGGSIHSFTGYVKDINPAYVTVEFFEEGSGDTEKYNPEDTMFLLEMSDEDIRDKYNKDAGELVKAIQNRMRLDEIGYKEQWNGWIFYDPWEMAQKCKQEGIRILGHCTDITPKKAYFSGELLDVGICAEQDGERFWCHARSKDIAWLVRKYKKYQEYVKAGKPGELQGVFAVAEREPDGELAEKAEKKERGK